jgi:hypothetical protein
MAGLRCHPGYGYWLISPYGIKVATICLITTNVISTALCDPSIGTVENGGSIQNGIFTIRKFKFTLSKIFAVVIGTNAASAINAAFCQLLWVIVLVKEYVWNRTCKYLPLTKNSGN